MNEIEKKIAENYTIDELKYYAIKRNSFYAFFKEHGIIDDDEQEKLKHRVFGNEKIPDNAYDCEIKADKNKIQYVELVRKSYRNLEEFYYSYVNEKMKEKKGLAKIRVAFLPLIIFILGYFIPMIFVIPYYEGNPLLCLAAIFAPLVFFNTMKERIKDKMKKQYSSYNIAKEYNIIDSVICRILLENTGLRFK